MSECQSPGSSGVENSGVLWWRGGGEKEVTARREAADVRVAFARMGGCAVTKWVMLRNVVVM